MCDCVSSSGGEFDQKTHLFKKESKFWITLKENTDLPFKTCSIFLYQALFHPTPKWGCNFSKRAARIWRNLPSKGKSLPGRRGACLKQEQEIRTCLCPQASPTAWPAAGSTRLIVVILNVQINCKDNLGVCVGKIFPDQQVSIQNKKECIHSLHETSLFSCLICNIRFSPVLLMVSSLLGKFSNNIIELVTAQSHYWLHLFYFLWFRMSSVAHSNFPLLSQKLVHFKQTKYACVSWTIGYYLADGLLFFSLHKQKIPNEMWFKIFVYASYNLFSHFSYLLLKYFTMVSFFSGCPSLVAFFAGADDPWKKQNFLQ